MAYRLLFWTVVLAVIGSVAIEEITSDSPNVWRAVFDGLGYGSLTGLLVVVGLGIVTGKGGRFPNG